MDIRTLSNERFNMKMICPYCNKKIDEAIGTLTTPSGYSSYRKNITLVCCPLCRKVLGVI